MGDILCFETEAASIMTESPCLVIRGAPDYADSHKNGEWQHYAAAATAGCAKELLSHLNPGTSSARVTASSATSSRLWPSWARSSIFITRNHPHFGVSFRSARGFDDQAAEITRHLDAYEQSLKRFGEANLSSHGSTSMNAHSEEAHKTEDAAGDGVANGPETVGTPPAYSAHTTASNSRLTVSDIQTRIVLTYGTHVMHVLHILPTGSGIPSIC